jgi:hypothetical protein
MPYRFSLGLITFDGADRLRAQGSMDMSSSNMSRSGGITCRRGVEHVGDFTSYYQMKHPLSIVCGPVVSRHVLLVVTPVADDDPLVEMPAAAFARSRREDFPLVTQGQAHGLFGRHRHADYDVPVRALAFAIHVGTSALALLAAAVLLAQLFRRRSLALAGTLALTALYVAVLDRAALGAHLSRLEDKEASPAVRLAACAHAADTFFHRRTAFRRIGAMIDDGGTSTELRGVCREALEVLDPEQYLRRMLDYPDEQVRLEAAEMLLFGRSYHKVWSLRLGAQILPRRDAAAVRTLRRLLGSTDADVRIKAAMALADVGVDDGRDELNGRLEENVLWVLPHLARVADESSIPFLIAQLRNPDNDKVVASGSSGRKSSDNREVITSSYSRTLKEEIALVLSRITGEDFGVDAGSWQAWYESRRPNHQ